MRARTKLRREGAAMIEAVIALPVLVIVLIAVPYVHHIFRAHQVTMSDARYAAWSNALGKCSGADTGPAIDAFGIADALEPVPGLKDVIDYGLPQALEATSNRTVQRPKLIESETDEIRTSTNLTCNERWPALDDGILNALRKSIGLDVP